MFRRFTLITLALAVVAVALGTGPAYSQDGFDPVGDIPFMPDDLAEPDSFGTGFQTYVIPAADFVPQASLDYSYASSGYIYRTAGPATTWWAPITLPAGANLFMMVALVYDTSASDILAQWGAYGLHQGSSPPPFFHEFSNASSSGTGGYGYIWFAGPTLIRYYTDLNDDGTDDWLAYRVTISLPATGSSMRFAGVVVSWQRTMSPAPASATFPDVPTSHWAFRYVEALVDSGITEGFPDGTFRPTDPVTRGQLATFLTRALGLHWAD